MCSDGARVLLLTGTHNRAQVGLLVLLFSGPWFGFYSHHLSAVRLKASLVSKGGDERRMTCLCSLPKRAFWDTNQGMTVRAGSYLQLGAQRAKLSLSADSSLSSWCFSFFSPTTCLCRDVEGSPLCVWLPLSAWGLGGLVAAERAAQSLAVVLTFNKFVRQSVKITATLFFVFFFFSELYQGSRLW